MKGLLNYLLRLVRKTCRYEVVMSLRQRDCFPLQKRTDSTHSVQLLWADESAYKLHTSRLTTKLSPFCILEQMIHICDSNRECYQLFTKIQPFSLAPRVVKPGLLLCIQAFNLRAHSNTGQKTGTSVISIETTHSL